MPLWRVSVSGTTISAPVKLFEVSPNVGTAKTSADEAKTAASNAQKTADDAKTAASTAQTTANAAMPKSGGTFSGQVAAGSANQSPSAYCLRNTRLSSTDTDPAINGQICWTYG